MSFLKILTSPGGIEGTRASVEFAVKTNLRRADGGSSFESRAIAVAATLTNRYRVVRRDFDPGAILFEAAPLAWPTEERVPKILAEYVVDQEFPGRSEIWFSEMMPKLLAEFLGSGAPEAQSAIGGIFTALSTNRLQPHWGKWLTEDSLGVIYDKGRAHLEERRPDLFPGSN